MMNKNNNERKCKQCGKTIVGKNRFGICSACMKKDSDNGLKTFGALTLTGSVIGVSYKLAKAITKK